MPDNVVWTWVRLGNLNWTEVQKGSSSELTLTEPQQSGLYQCHAESPLSQTSQSRDHAVYIVSMHATGWWSVLNCCTFEWKQNEI